MSDFSTEYARVKNNISGAYSKISEMGGTLPVVQNSDNLADAIDSIETGISIDGYIRQRKVDTNNSINKGAFITTNENIWNNVKQSTLLENIDEYEMRTTKINDNKIFLTYIKNNICYGRICNFNQENLTLGTEIEITSFQLYSWQVVILGNKIIFSYSRKDDSSRMWYAKICTINSEDVVTIGNQKLINGTQNTGAYQSFTVLNDEYVFAAFSYGSGNNLSCTVLSILDNQIVAGTVYTIDSNSSNGSSDKASALISSNKIIIVYGATSYFYALKGTICQISGTYVTINTSTYISNSNSSGHDMHLIIIDNNTVLVTHSGSSTYPLYAIICTINDTSITPATDTLINNATLSSSSNYPVQIASNKVLIIGNPKASTNYNRNLFTALIEISVGASINIINSSTDETIELYNNTTSVYYVDDEIFILYQSSDTNICMIIKATSIQSISNNEDKIYGIAAESGIAGDTIDVYVPNV